MRAGCDAARSAAPAAGVAERWRAAWGEEVVVAARAADRRAAAARSQLRAGEPPPAWRASACCPAICACRAGTRSPTSTGYGEGGWWVQDIAASLPARLLGAGEGRTVLDLCAAPGGKTMQLAAAGFG